MDTNVFDRAEQLLVNKQIDELTDEERKFLIGELGDMEQVENFRDVLLEAGNLLSASANVPEPDVFTAERVKARMRTLKREREERKGFFAGIASVLNYRVRVYQSVLAMLGVIVLFFLFTDNDHNDSRMINTTLYADSSAVHSDSVMMERR